MAFDISSDSLDSPAKVARAFLLGGVASSRVTEVLRASYNADFIQNCVNELVQLTGATASTDRRIAGFSTIVSNAVPRVLGPDGKPTRVPAVPQLAVSWKATKEFGARGKGTKTLHGRVILKPAAKSPDAGREYVTAAMALLVSAYRMHAEGADVAAAFVGGEKVTVEFGSALNACESALQMLRSGVIVDTETGTFMEKLRGALEGFADKMGGDYVRIVEGMLSQCMPGAAQEDEASQEGETE